MKSFMDSRWNSRKLLMAVSTMLFIIITDVSGIQIDPETYWGLVALVVSYVGGQGYVDAKKLQSDAEIQKEKYKQHNDYF